MKITKNGITKSIDVRDWNYYCERGWKKSGCSEPQPSQEGLFIVDDYTISRQDSIHNSNP